MSLRLQLLAFGLLTLALPWAGMRFVQQMEAALRTGLESALLASAGTVATALENSAAWPLVPGADAAADTARTIYAHALSQAPRVDGFRNDWVFPRLGSAADPDLAAFALGDGNRVWAGVAGRFVYLFIDVTDDDVIYQGQPGTTPIGDRVAILLADGAGATRALLLSTAAPGSFRLRSTEIGRFAPGESYEDRALGAWQESASGFGIELRLPLALVDDALGIGIIDVDRAPDGYAVTLASTWQGAAAVPGPFVHARPEIDAIIEQFTRVGDRYRVVDGAGWVLADSGRLVPAAAEAPGTGSLAERFFRYALRRDDPEYDGLERPPGRLGDARLAAALEGDPATAWFRQGPGASAVVAAAVPVAHASGWQGAVLLEQVSDSVLTLTNQALMRLMLFTVLVSLVAAAGLLAYATFLSFRVRRLARAAESALGPRGEINERLPGAAARDELGDLSRSFQQLLGRLREYTDYLRTLTSKLTHELRTPLAIVSTSLDNLEHELEADSANAYLERLRQGTVRLEGILTAMAAATRVEQAIDQAGTERFDLAAVVAACVNAYRDVYPGRAFELRLPGGELPVSGSSDLLAQLMDKLVENAASFAVPGTPIVVAVDVLADELRLSIANRGPALPEAMRHQLFDSLVSVRDEGDGRPHLGLGLYIVALIAKHHGGRVEAANLPSADGVIFSVYFPRGR